MIASEVTRCYSCDAMRLAEHLVTRLTLNGAGGELGEGGIGGGEDSQGSLA